MPHSMGIVFDAIPRGAREIERKELFLIEVDRISKRYGTVSAVDDLSFSVESGVICGLLGPNGAGKSTTMNIMTGCLAASSGEVRYDGLEIYSNRKEVKKSIGYLPEQPPLYPEMTSYEYLMFVGKAKGLSAAEAYGETRELSKLCGLHDVSDRLIKNLSKGYRQRVGIAQALLGDPKTVVLDEPTVGLDPVQIIEIRNLIRRLGENRTIVVSSHILSEIRALCDQIVIVSHGRVVADETPEQLEKLFSGTSSTLLIVKADELAIRSVLSDVSCIENIEIAPSQQDEGALEVRLAAKEGEDVRESVFRAFAAGDLAVLEMTTSKATLEDVFVELTSDPSPLPVEERCVDPEDEAASEAMGVCLDRPFEEEGDRR